MNFDIFRTISDIDQLMGCLNTLLFTDQKGHRTVGQIAILTIQWIFCLLDWNTDIRVVAQNILDSKLIAKSEFFSKDSP